MLYTILLCHSREQPRAIKGKTSTTFHLLPNFPLSFISTRCGVCKYYISELKGGSNSMRCVAIFRAVVASTFIFCSTEKIPSLTLFALVAPFVIPCFKQLH